VSKNSGRGFYGPVHTGAPPRPALGGAALPLPPSFFSVRREGEGAGRQVGGWVRGCEKIPVARSSRKKIRPRLLKKNRFG